MRILILLFGSGLILFLLFCALNTYFTFTYLYIDYNINRLQQPQKFPIITNKHFFKQYGIEFYYAIGKFIFYPFKFVDLTVRPTNVTQKYAIVLVHGYARNQSDWLWFRKQFSDLGAPVYLVNLTPPFGSIQEIAANTLAPKINAIKQQTGCDKIVLISHSMGGLVSSYYAEHLDSNNSVSKLINIATPFHGTKLSIASVGENSIQMYPYSKFGKELREQISHSKKDYYLILTTFDNIIFPWDSVILDSVPENRRLLMNYISHLSLLHSPEVVTQVKKWLNS